MILVPVSFFEGPFIEETGLGKQDMIKVQVLASIITVYTVQSFLGHNITE